MNGKGDSPRPVNKKKFDDGYDGARNSLNAVGLFAGIGGFERGLAAAGHRPTLLCEIDPAARAVLDVRFPNVDKHSDILKLKSLPAGTDLLVGGFPCQDLSQAGQTQGITGRRSGLVREVFRLAQKCRVPWLVLENVPFMLQLGGGQALNVIVNALEALNYHWAYRVVDSRAFGVPQRRQRVFIVASLTHDPRTVLFADETSLRPDRGRTARDACGFYWTEGLRGLGWAVDAVPTLKGGSTLGVASPPAIWLPNGDFITPSIQDAERMQGFPADWTKPAELVSRPGYRWRLVGNAVTVNTVRWLARRLARPGKPHLIDTQPLGRGKWPPAAFNVGGGRFSNRLSPFPKQIKSEPLADFLSDEGKLLSRRATAGFLGRTARAQLRFPPGFLVALQEHLNRMSEVQREQRCA